MRLQEKVVLVVGGASGIGAAIATLFAKEGAKVVIGDIDEQKAKAVAARIQEAGGCVCVIRVDVASEQQVQEFVATALKEFGRIDILQNPVGLAHFSPTEDLTLDHWRRVLDVNLTGVFLCCREVGKVMIRQGAGKIVNYSSAAGIAGSPYVAHYTVAKHGVVGLTRVLAVEWGKYNICVNCIVPGPVRTPMLLELPPPGYWQEMVPRIPLQRLGEPEEQAYLALFLSSAEAGYISGAIICADGGTCAMAPGTSNKALAGKFTM